MIDFAFVLAYLVCFVCICIFGENHLNAVWRVTLGLGIVPPMFLLYFRLRMKEVSDVQRCSLSVACVILQELDATHPDPILAYPQAIVRINS